MTTTTINRHTNIYETFKEDEEKNIQFVRTNAHKLDKEEDTQFALQLADYYDTKGYLSAKQMDYMIKYWLEINAG